MSSNLEELPPGFKVQWLNSTLKFLKNDAKLVYVYPEMHLSHVEYFHNLISQHNNDVGLGFKAMYAPLWETMKIFSLKYKFKVTILKSKAKNYGQLIIEKIPKKQENGGKVVDEDNLKSDEESLIVSRRVSGRQLDRLWEYLNSNKDIATAYNRSLHAKEYSKRKWCEVTEVLNSQSGGAHKDWRGWSKYWVDYKAKLKKKAAAVRSVGEPFIEQPLNERERKFLQILGEDFGLGLPGVQMESMMEPFAEPSGSIAAVVESFLIQTTLDPLLLEPDEAPQQPEDPLQHPDSQEQPTLITPTPPPTQCTAASVASAKDRVLARRRRRRKPPMSQEAARRALVRSSQTRAKAAVRSSQALGKIAEGLQFIHSTLQNIERYFNFSYI